ncbi:MAG: chaperonin GroEL [Planctomycetaceae bacterium]|nr:60 kDa chaperonin 5 [Planctomycetota bacterium]MCQ3949701.1 chaperonin GroEL [Planctomycetota bacterium]NUO16114.1 chaperonin GroEL [Planctomycetaceae bacterium]GIK53372.1 MAG: 60 kDa chaperonin [Planctomycetota bacterium]HRJ79422.1 chaperonin GroEL [Planctomycetota bacterium]
MAKQILYDLDARKKIANGVHQLARAVKQTLGPSGRLALMNKSFGGPAAVNDGVTVAKEIELADPFENMGAKLVQEVASKTNDEAGDGTSTATVIAEAVIDEGLKMLATGIGPQDLKRGIDKAVEVAVACIKENAKKIKNNDELKAVATISANQDGEIGGLMAEAIEKVGDEGVVTVEEGKGLKTELEYVDGLSFDKGYMSPYFITNPNDLTCEFDNPLILLYEKKISSVRELIPLLEKVAQSGKPLLIVSEDIDAEVLATLVVNRLRGTLQVCAVKAPGFGDRRKAMLDDLAIVTGGQHISEDIGVTLESVTVEQLGRAKRVTVDKDNTTIIEGGGKKRDIEARCGQLRTQIEQSQSQYDREKLQERLAKLVGGVAMIRVGGHTEAEMKERKFRVDDALHATRAAKQEGIVPGGGVTYLRAAQAIRDAKFSGDERFGAQVLAAALEAPTRQIAENSGQDGRLVVESIKEKKVFSFGYNALKGEYGDMLKMGVIDPAKVARCAIQNAASVAGLILTTNTLVTDVKDKKSVAGAVA